MHRNMPRTERFGIGLRIDNQFLDLLEFLRKAMYSPMPKKLEILENALTTTDSIRFFLQISWETKLVPNDQFIALGKEIEEIGKIVGGWKKGLLAKTPTAGVGERK